MSRHVFFCCTLVLALVMVTNQTTFGWGGPSHSALTTKTFDDPIVIPKISGFNQSTVENYTGEPGDWQDGQWENVNARAYIDGMTSPNGLNWQSLDETTRVKYMMHNLADVAVPIGHSPACINPGGYSNDINEAILEAQVSLWGSYPSVFGTTSYTHNRNGHSYNFTGTIYDILDTFYDACRDNMTWFKSTRNIVGMHSIEDNSDAGWNGTTLALMLMRAMFVDYKLSQNPITVYAPNASGTNSILFDQHLSYDPDCVSWNADATYDKVRGIQPQGIQFFWYDLDNDGDLDVQSFNNTMTVSADTLINTYGAERGQWNYYRVRAKDNEGVVTYKTGKFYLNPLGTPEPASLSLLAVGALAFLRRKR